MYVAGITMHYVAVISNIYVAVISDNYVVVISYTVIMSPVLANERPSNFTGKGYFCLYIQILRILGPI